jgi:HNH endonuclease
MAGSAKKAPSKTAVKKMSTPNERKGLSLKTKTAVLTESGYRCAVPTCRNILALDMHHMYQVAHGGDDSPSNLIALCPTCHALYHRGTISADAIYSYKSMLVAISRAFDIDAVDRLLFLNALAKDALIVSGDGVLRFDRLIAAGLAIFDPKANNGNLIVTYSVNISAKGRLLIEAWKSGDRDRLKQTMAGPIPGITSDGSLPPAGRTAPKTRPGKS